MNPFESHSVRVDNLAELSMQLAQRKAIPVLIVTFAPGTKPGQIALLKPEKMTAAEAAEILRAVADQLEQKGGDK